MVFFVPIFIEIVFQRKQEQRIPKVHLVVLTTSDLGLHHVLFHFTQPQPQPHIWNDDDMCNVKRRK